ncbi:hypothetical protein [Rhodopirellula baltica]|uniref:hypothetical protein n=1 Tax=Rhodopirellula baltica TaxID=265606 RepID=UPI0002DC2064|nr:hypothetical protein [Rhodopirellula baltica]
MNRQQPSQWTSNAQNFSIAVMQRFRDSAQYPVGELPLLISCISPAKRSQTASDQPL